MSAKKSKRPTPSAGLAQTASIPAAAASSPTAPSLEATPAWIESADPRRRQIGKIVLAGVWLYVAALWLLALDQLFHWGIFGPKIPPTP
jgi:hypothetical protein